MGNGRIAYFIINFLNDDYCWFNVESIKSIVKTCGTKSRNDLDIISLQTIFLKFFQEYQGQLDNCIDKVSFFQTHELSCKFPGEILTGLK